MQIFVQISDTYRIVGSTGWKLDANFYFSTNMHHSTVYIKQKLKKDEYAKFKYILKFLITGVNYSEDLI